jgi:GNAT superfamily N-acetyltransferase
MTMLDIVIQDDPNPDDISRLVQALVAYNDATSDVEHHRKLAAFIHDNEELIAGIGGYTHWQWLFVGHLWVDASARGKGLGSALLRAAEQRALERGCKWAWLDTFSFQTPDFYRRQGYTEFGALPDYPPGFTHHFLWKSLDQ